jgi:hypothetical protein
MGMPVTADFAASLFLKLRFQVKGVPCHDFFAELHTGENLYASRRSHT